MRRHLALLPILALTLAASPALGEPLTVGTRAPDFELASSEGGKVRLSEVLKERGGAVLAWFPRAFTGG